MAETEVESDPDSHTRSIAIFASYFSICIVLLSLCLSTIRFRNFSRARGSWMFALLTFASLGSTWYYMIAFFMKSYSDWEVSQGPSVDGAIRLGPWLKDVKLFEQAWGTVVEEPARWWWSQQIFLATCGWTVFLAAEGSRRRIRHLWAFMALGQVVAISFVVNLFFLAIVLHDASPPPPQPAPKTNIAARKTDELPSWLYYSVTIPMAVTFMFSFLTPSTIGTPSFMPFLLIPHILLLFVPAFFENLASQGVLDLYLPASKFRGFWRPQYRFCALISAICQNLAFFAVAATLPGADAKEVIMRIVAALYDHPAVSSVGWDVIMVGVSVGMWVGVCGGNFGMNVERRLGKGGDWMGAVVGWALMGVGSVGMNALAFGGELGG